MTPEDKLKNFDKILLRKRKNKNKPNSGLTTSGFTINDIEAMVKEVFFKETAEMLSSSDSNNTYAIDTEK